MKNVIYLIALEKVFDNAIFDNQVKKLLLELKRSQGEKLNLTLLVLLPWIELTRRGPYSNFRLYRDHLSRLKQELAGQGIELVVKRTLFPSAFFNMKMPGLFYFVLITLPVVWFYILARRAHIVHCRYYYASFTALLAARLIPRRVKVIFDVRSLLPEQGIVNRIWRQDSRTFRCWKRVENWMVNAAGRVICVAPAMTDWIVKAHPQALTEMIPNFVDLEHFGRDEARRRELRRELEIEHKTVILYSGTLGGRYPAGRMAECVNLFFSSMGRECFFLVLTSSEEKRIEPLASQLKAGGLERGRDWMALEAPAAEVAGYLGAADWSLLVLEDFLTSETFLPIKFAEYLAAGLPVLTHPHNSGIVEILQKYQIGEVLNSELDHSELAARLRNNEDLMRENCIRTAREQFSLQHFTQRYWQIYEGLTAG